MYFTDHDNRYIVQSRGGRRAAVTDDDAAEGREQSDVRNTRGGRDGRDGRDGREKRKKAKGQNTARQFGSWGDKIQLCNSRARSNELAPKTCKFGDACRLGHDLRKYLAEGKRGDLTTFDGRCPVWEVNGICHAGWKCRFVASHSEEVERDDGRKELVLTIDPARASVAEDEEDETRRGVVNAVSAKDKLALAKRTIQVDRAEQYSHWLENYSREIEKKYHERRAAKDELSKQDAATAATQDPTTQITSQDAATAATNASNLNDIRAQYIEPPFLPSEKRRIYFGPETPVLAPLTTQGNLPFRRLCVQLGAQATYSEMAMGMPLIQGQKSEWALMKAHESEMQPPRYTPRSIVQDYDPGRDFKFGAQISANKPWIAAKTTEVLAKLVPRLRVIDLNCGCPIDLVYRTGAGSALLDSPGKLEKMIRSMHAVSGEIPITAKIRMGTATGKPNAIKNIERLAFGSHDMREHLGAPGCAAITLHGRSRQQRYTKSADWSYIAECAALVRSYHEQKDALTDTIGEPDARTLANTSSGKMYFLGNGDCYSHVDYQKHIDEAGVDAVMLARGAMIKPWLFEEIQTGQYLDKSASERLGYVEQFVRYGLESWGSDEQGVGQTRRFLLEWLSFAHRYVPLGLLEHLPPSLQDRPPAYRGRNELETLLASDNYLDWIKIRCVLFVLQIVLQCDVLTLAVKCFWVRRMKILDSSQSIARIVTRWRPKAEKQDECACNVV